MGCGGLKEYAEAKQRNDEIKGQLRCDKMLLR
jgi:hypothetical protein